MAGCVCGFLVGVRWDEVFVSAGVLSVIVRLVGEGDGRRRSIVDGTRGMVGRWDGKVVVHDILP